MLTASAVTTPPRPCGPMPSRFTASSQLVLELAQVRDARSAMVNGRSTAFLARSAACSKVPPIPTPTTIGGHALAPARSTVSITTSRMPATPSAGTSIRKALMFSAPKPLDATVTRTSSPGTRSTWMTPGVSPPPAIFSRRVGIAGDRPSQISGRVPSRIASYDRVVQRTADEVDVLSDFEHDDRHAAVLADRQPLFGGDLVVPNELLDRASPERRLFARDRVAQRGEHVGGDLVIALDEEARDRVAQRRYLDVAHPGGRGRHAGMVPPLSGSRSAAGRVGARRAGVHLVDHSCQLPARPAPAYPPC